MKVCVLLICLLVDGSATECRRGVGSHVLIDLEHVTTSAGCKAVADDVRSGALPLPANMRFVRREMLPPKQPETQEAKR